MEASATDMTDGVWLTVAELAKRKGITRQSMTGRVNRLESEGRIQTRRDGRSRMVELATYDRAVGAVGDAAKEAGAETKRFVAMQTEEPVADGSRKAYRDAQAEKAAYDAKMKALDYGERTGQLLPVRGEHGIETALVKTADTLLRQLDAPLDWIDDILEAAKLGQPDLRRLLKRKIRLQKAAVATAMAGLAGEAEAATAEGVQVDIHFEDDHASDA